MVSCARTGTPSGGPKDITPPKLLKASPDTLSTNVPVDIKGIKLYFDELVQLQDYSKNVLISPPLEPSPTFSPIGTPAREVEVTFNAPLEKNTTYTLNFGKAIVDNNEYNPFSYFTYVFSTGNKIDSLTLSGSVKDLLNKKPEKDMIAALYEVDSTYNDSAVFRKKPLYITKLDTLNNFKFAYLKPGKFRLVAFNDKIPNVRIDPKEERMAFADSIIDTRKIKQSPDLYLFSPQQSYRYVDAKQVGYGRIDFYVTGNPKELKIKPISPEISDTLIQHKTFGDTLQFYFNPKKLDLKERNNRFKFALIHDNITDSIPPVTYDNSVKQEFKIFGRNLNYNPEKHYEISSDTPIDSINIGFISVKSDTTNIAFKPERVNLKTFKLVFPIAFEKSYNIQVLPGAFTDWFGKKNDSLSLSFNTGKEKDFGNIKITIKNKPKYPFWIKLLDNSNKVVESIYSSDDTFTFNHLIPKKYNLQLWVDENENKKYDTGDILQKKQPEKIYLYPKQIVLKAYWDINETWILPET